MTVKLACSLTRLDLTKDVSKLLFVWCEAVESNLVKQPYSDAVSVLCPNRLELRTFQLSIEWAPVLSLSLSLSYFVSMDSVQKILSSGQLETAEPHKLQCSWHFNSALYSSLFKLEIYNQNLIFLFFRLWIKNFGWPILISNLPIEQIKFIQAGSDDTNWKQITPQTQKCIPVRVHFPGIELLAIY